MNDLFANLPVVLLLLSTLCIGAVAMLTRELPFFPGRSAFVALLFAAALWTAGVAFEYLEIPVGGKMRVAALTWGAILQTPACWALFAWQYVNRDRRPVPRPWLVAQGVMTVATLAVGFTNSRHHLLYRGATPLGPALGAPLIYRHGPWYWLLVAYIYALMISALGWLIVGILRSSGRRRRHYLVIALAALIPWGANLAFVAGWFAPAGLDTAPLSFIFMGFLLYLLIRREGRET